MFGFKASKPDFWTKTIERLMKTHEKEEVDVAVEGVTKRDMWTPEIAAIFVDEAGMMATHHLFKLLDNLPDERVMPVRRLIFMGDHKQLAPISNGNPFKRMVQTMQDVTVELVKNHRTGVDQLLSALKEIKTGDELFLKRIGFKGKSFGWTAIGNANERTSNARAQRSYMSMIGEKMYRLLEEIDPDKSKYKETIALVPYNDMRAYVGFVMSNYYFGHRLTVEQMHSFSTTRYRRKGEGLPILSVNMRVVFTTNNKLDLDKENRFSRGQLGIIEKIIDSTKNHETPTRENYRYLETKGPSFRQDTTERETDVYYDTRTFIIHSYTDPSRKYHVYVNMKFPSKIFDVVDVGNAITVMRAQGQSLKNVVLVLPHGVNLSTRDMLYTGASRAVNMLRIIGSYDQVSKMLNTTSDIGNSFLKFLLSKPDDDEEKEKEKEKEKDEEKEEEKDEEKEEEKEKEKEKDEDKEDEKEIKKQKIDNDE